MRKLLIIAAFVGTAFAVPTFAAQAGDCASTGVGTTATGNYNASTSDAVVGACVETGQDPFHGGSAEVGTGDPGTYAVVDGDNDNTNPGVMGAGEDDLQGYVGVSTYENGTKDADCDTADEGTGSNSGGCLMYDGPGGPVPVTNTPVVCGASSGNDFGNSDRDGCKLGS